ncbi:carboxymuconolactone decarboxylase family protein [Rhodanobacter sp. DHG33]|uniref:carboxymuconolactone decarboxylase family protein n=1 Tax=Rhodanobacter sp. DHG33 TaxID=2775921 RepID=UPI001782BB52|nr:carboxymuconolactone decarboxylase family protein [Rhodanobacter sp. DHG33]MBD8900599.1 carboxymuconolactone decarboxylase family protein [Rhodanobacter sp. DHG33]
MPAFPIHTLETAPNASRTALQGLQSAFGFIPNIAGAMATSPVLINCLAAVFQNVHGGSFSEPQIQTLLLTNAVTNTCTWAVAFHSSLSLKNSVAPADVQAIRDGDLPSDAQLAALSRLARALIEKRGCIDAHDQLAFLQAGFGPDQLLEVIAIVAASTITNYTGSVTQPPLEPEFQPQVWVAFRE